jgi:hypothetical protein
LSYAVFLSFTEQDLQVDGRAVHYRVAGDAKNETKAGVLPVLCLGDAGLSMDALEPMELLAQTQRRIIRIDSLGTGDSESVAESVATSRADIVALAALEARAVLASLGVGSQARPVHLFCAGFGAEVAGALASGDNPISIASAAVEHASTYAWTPFRSNGKPLPICVEDGFARGSTAIAAAARTRSSSEAFAEATAQLAATRPVIWIEASEASASLEESPQPVHMSALASSSSGSIKRAEFARGATGTPHVDDANAMLESLDNFYLHVEDQLGMQSSIKKK